VEKQFDAEIIIVAQTKKALIMKPQKNKDWKMLCFQIQNGDLEAALFDDGAAKVQEKTTKDSILALYGSGGSSQLPQQQMYGVPGELSLFHMNM